MLAWVAAGFNNPNLRARNNVEADFDSFETCKNDQLALPLLSAPKEREPGAVSKAHHAHAGGAVIKAVAVKAIPPDLERIHMHQQVSA